MLLRAIGKLLRAESSSDSKVSRAQRQRLNDCICFHVFRSASSELFAIPWQTQTQSGLPALIEVPSRRAGRRSSPGEGTQGIESEFEDDNE